MAKFVRKWLHRFPVGVIAERQDTVSHPLYNVKQVLQRLVGRHSAAGSQAGGVSAVSIVVASPMCKLSYRRNDH